MNPNLVASRQVDGSRRRRRICHPVQFRLSQEFTEFPIHDPKALIGIGFVLLTLAIIRVYRVGPILLHILFENENDPTLYTFKEIGKSMIYTWKAIVMSSLIISGIILLYSGKVRRRCILLLPSWILLLVYLDVVVWSSMAIYMHTTCGIGLRKKSTCFKKLDYPIIHMSFIYLDIVIFLITDWILNTYLLTAQLTIIEMHY